MRLHCSEYKKGRQLPLLARDHVRIQLASQVLHKLAINATRTIHISARIEERAGQLKIHYRRSLLNPIERRGRLPTKESNESRLSETAIRVNRAKTSSARLEQSSPVTIMRQLQGIYSSAPARIYNLIKSGAFSGSDIPSNQMRARERRHSFVEINLTPERGA